MEYITIYDPDLINEKVILEAKKIILNGNHINLCIANANRSKEFWESINLLLDIDNKLQLSLATALYVDKNKGWGDLFFLRDLTRLKRIIISDEIDNLDNILFLEELLLLSISEQKTKKSLLPILKFKGTLEQLVVSKNITDLHCISKLINLRGLNLLGSLQFDVFDFLPLTKLSRLWMFNNIKFKNLDYFHNLNSINELFFYSVKNINDFCFLENMPSLKSLLIENNKNITSLPNLETLNTLKILKLNNISKLTNLNILYKNDNIESFGHFLSNNEPEDYTFLIGMTNLKHIVITFKESEKTKRFESIKRKLNGKCI